MKKKVYLGIIILVAICYFSFSLISARDYSIEFNQVGNKLVVKETIGGLSRSYVNPRVLEKTSGGYYFVNKIEFNETYEKATVRLNLDQGFFLDKDIAFPEGYVIESDGTYISIIWELENIRKGDTFPIFVKIKTLNALEGFIYFLIGLGAILIIIYLLYVRIRKAKSLNIRKKISKRKVSGGRIKNKIDYAYLLDEERKIIEILKKSERNELWQKNIQASLGLSKAKTSRLIRNLEARNLIKKIAFGNTNKIVLK